MPSDSDSVDIPTLLAMFTILRNEISDLGYACSDLNSPALYLHSNETILSFIYIILHVTLFKRFEEREFLCTHVPILDIALVALLSCSIFNNKQSKSKKMEIKKSTIKNNVKKF